MSALPPPPAPEHRAAGGPPPVDPYTAQAPHGTMPPGPDHTSPAAGPLPAGAPAPYYGAPAPAGTDGVSIAALVTGILSLGPVALILGIVGVRRTSRSGRGGKGMAIAGIVLGALSTVGWTILLLIATLFVTNDEVQDAVREGMEDGWQLEAGLDVGACLSIPDDPSNIGAAMEVDCASVHTAEVIATKQFTEDAYPGDEAVAAAADEFCLGEFSGYIGAEYEESSLELYYGMPTSTTWSFGDRQIACYVIPMDGSQLTASVAGSGL